MMEFTNGDVADAAANEGSDVTESQIPENNDSGSGSGSTGGNPAWNDLLEALPTSLHPVVTPHLSKWDQGVEKRFETVQSQYAPYKSILDQGIDPAQLEQSLTLMEMVNKNPRAVYDKMVEFYGEEWGLNGGQGQKNDDAENYSLDDEDGENRQPQADIENHPYIKQMREQQEMIAGFLAEKVQSETRAKAEAEIQSELGKISEKHGELTPQHQEFIVALALQKNINLVQAADMFYGSVPQAQQQSAPGGGLPPIVPTTGGVPSSQVDPRTLSSRDTKSLVASYLAQVNDPNNR